MKNVIQLLLDEKVQQEQDIMAIENEISEGIVVKVGRGYTDTHLRQWVSDKHKFIAEINEAIIKLLRADGSI